MQWPPTWERSSLLSCFFIRSIEIVCIFSRAFYDAKSRRYSFTTPLSPYLSITKCEINLFLNHGIRILANCGGEGRERGFQNMYIHENVCSCMRTNRRMLKYMRDKEDKKEDPSLGVCATIDDRSHLPMFVLRRDPPQKH